MSSVSQAIKDCKSLSDLLDEDLMEYFIGVLEETDRSSVDGLFESLVDLLMGYGLCETEDQVKEICIDLHAEFSKTETAPAEESNIKLLNAPLNLSAIVQEDNEIRAQKLEASKGASSIPIGFHSKNKTIEESDKIKETSGYQKKMAKEKKEREKVMTYDPNSNRKNVEESFKLYMEARGKGGPVEVNIPEITLQTNKNFTLLENTPLRLPRGRRFGLIGRNGVGKTSLLRAMSSYSMDGFPRNLKVLHVEQEIVGDGKSVLQTILDSDLERSILMKRDLELQQLIEKDVNEALLKELEEVNSRLNEIDAHTAEGRASIILSGLNFTQEMQHGSTSALSGGWRMRVSLASALFISPDILLLDEPTNHLDFPTILWLEEYLQKYQNTIMIVSHDRDFLNNVCTDIINLNNKELKYYRGDYDSFVKVQREQYIAQKRAYDAQQMQIAHIQEFITTFYNEKKSSAQDKKTKLVQSRQKTLEKMVRIEDPDKELAAHKIILTIPDPGSLRKNMLIQTDELVFGFDPSNLLLKNVTVQVELNSRIGILGANGAGKSTLIKLLLGELHPQKGKVTMNSNLRCGIFAQHHVDELDLMMTPIECIRERFPSMEIKEVRSYLGRFGLTDDLQLTQIGYLSGGQKSRVAFSIIVKSEPHLVVLDEPTNHLDMETIDALIEAINSFKGAVVLVSHDQYFLKQVAHDFWAVGNGKLSAFKTLAEAKSFSYNMKQ